MNEFLTHVDRVNGTGFNRGRVVAGCLALATSLLSGCSRPREHDAGPSPALESAYPKAADPAEAAIAVVYVNGVALSATTVRMLEQQYRMQVRPGRYWYDNVCGAVGLEGQGTAGFLPAGLRLGGSLQASASKGSSRVFINGRELTSEEAAALRQLTPVMPGRYWLDAAGNAGIEGGPAVCNLMQLSQRGQGSHSSRSSITGVGVVGDGNFAGVIGSGWSVTAGD